MDLPYDFKLEYISELISRNKYRKILIQLPNGLKKYYKQIVDYLSEKHPGIEIYVSLSPTYGMIEGIAGHEPWRMANASTLGPQTRRMTMRG
jgi:hypothetical protein